MTNPTPMPVGWWLHSSRRAMLVVFDERSIDEESNAPILAYTSKGNYNWFAPDSFIHTLPEDAGFDWKPEPEIVFPVWCVPTTQNKLSLKDRKAVACFRYDTKESGTTFHCDGTSFEWNAGWLDTTTMRVVSKEEALARITSIDIVSLAFDPKTFTSDWGPFPKSAEPDPEEWVTQDRVPDRTGIDQWRWVSKKNGTACRWYDSEQNVSYMHGHEDKDEFFEVRCRRKDLPPFPEQPSKPNRIPVRLYWYDGNVVARYGHTPPADPSFVEIKLDPERHISDSGFYIEGTGT